MSKKALLLVLIIIVTIGSALIFWRVQEATATAARIEAEAKAAKVESEILKGLTEEDLQLVLANQALVEPSSILAIVESAESRKIFLAGLKQYLALAARARREGLAEDANFKLNREFKKNMLLASLYQNKLDNDQKKYYDVPKEQIEAVWASPVNENQFNIEMQALQAIQKAVAESTGNPGAAVGGDGLLKSPKTREFWAKTKILSHQAKADSSFIRDHRKALDLRFKIDEAGILSSDYLRKYWSTKIKVTDEEIAAYLAAHPEYDLNKKREKAEAVLQRAKAGADFAGLAKEFSEDRSTKNIGGLYDEEQNGDLLPELKKAVLELQEGQFADQIIETNLGYHIIQLVKKQTKKEAGIENVKYRVNHILFQKRFAEPGNQKPGIPPPFMTATDIAKAELQNQKRLQFIDEVVKSENISLPDDFQFALTEDLKAIKENRSKISTEIEKDKQKLQQTAESSETREQK